MALEDKLNKPISWKSTDSEIVSLLKGLQGNILKSHGRENVRLLFLHFGGDAAASRKALATVTPLVMPALEQLQATEKYKKTGESARTFVTLFLTKTGYEGLGITKTQMPSGEAFLAGAKNRTSQLIDPPVSTWEPDFQKQIDALILIADDNAAKVLEVAEEISTELEKLAVEVAATQDGQALFNAAGDGIEHFGYVDGRSQPLMLVEDIKEEHAKLRKEGPKTIAWEPAFAPIPLALVKDPAVAEESAYGSYFVFRKLEQNVREFKRTEEQLAERLGLTGDAAELAGALAVGRFEDGTPVTLSETETGGPVRNNFHYKADKEGAKCPFHAHIRKTNPRGAGPGGLDDERTRIMARRGIPYGQRATHPNDPILEQRPDLFPTGGVGLLFMAYQNEIERQFEFTQSVWANNKTFPEGGAGLDPVIGQGDGEPQQWERVWGTVGDKIPFTFDGFVSLRGAEYFFAPSLIFLRSL